MADDMVLFTRTYDLLQWLLPKTEQFPKAYRFTIGRRTADAALDLQEKLLLAAKRSGAARRQLLQECDAHLDAIRLYLRLALDWRWLNAGQYEHASRLVAEVGRLLGGWLRQVKKEKAPRE
ncbi:MAG: diversity-generating retroelement protein Avd [Gammaproteobacteria bacterium]